MKTAAMALLGTVLLAGCSVSGEGNSACEVFSPAPVDVPHTQNDQRVETNTTGDPTGGRNNLQNCGSQ